MFRLNQLLFLIACSVLFLSSCISTQARWEKKNYQPQKGGVVYYNPKPNLFDPTVVEKRQQDAKMKMISFCDPSKPEVISEKVEEKVIGQSTNYSSNQTNPTSSYYSRETSKKDGTTQKESGYRSSPYSYSSGGSVSKDIIQNRVYITFQCN